MLLDKTFFEIWISEYGMNSTADQSDQFHVRIPDFRFPGKKFFKPTEIKDFEISKRPIENEEVDNDDEEQDRREDTSESNTDDESINVDIEQPNPKVSLTSTAHMSASNSPSSAKTTSPLPPAASSPTPPTTTATKTSSAASSASSMSPLRIPAQLSFSVDSILAPDKRLLHDLAVNATESAGNNGHLPRPSPQQPHHHLLLMNAAAAAAAAAAAGHAQSAFLRHQQQQQHLKLQLEERHRMEQEKCKLNYFVIIKVYLDLPWS